MTEEASQLVANLRQLAEIRGELQGSLSVYRT